MTFSSQKWPGVGAESGVGRCCAPRSGGPASRRCCSAPTPSWWRWCAGNWPRSPGSTAEPVDSHVQRWGGALPQYAVGHLQRVARIRADVQRVPGLAVCGASYDGVGIPACIGSAHKAADRVLAGLRPTRTMTVMVDGKQARELNDVIRYTAWSVFTVSRPLGDAPRPELAAEVEALFAELAGERRHRPGHLRRLGAARRRRADDLVARRDGRAAAGRPTAGSGGPGWAGTCSRSGR